jgi:chromosomal replication initiation ATPase DnaA
MIFTFPATEKQLLTFKCNQETKSEIHYYLENGLNELSIFRIESEAGNGKSHLLQAIAIELREKRTRIVYLHFNEGDSFSDLSVYHYNDILNATFLCIQNLDIPLKHHSSTEFLAFIKAFAKNKGKLIYSFEDSSNESNRIESCFNGKVNVLSLPPVSIELRKKWAEEILLGRFEPLKLCKNKGQIKG